MSRSRIFSGLLHLKQNKGFEPKTVIDVGAALGTFELYDAFPRARHFMIEPVSENEPYLATLCSKLPNAEYIIAAAASQSGIAELHISPELAHSSVTNVHQTQSQTSPPEPVADPYLRKVPAITVDEICQQYELEPPYLIKLDVDGNEPDVLLGATQALKDTEYLIIEVSLFGQIHDVIDVMRSQGFVIYDIVDLVYRPTDGALWQADMAFVKEEGLFRQSKSFVPEAHQENLNVHLRAWRDEYIKAIEELSLDEYCSPSGLETEAFEQIKSDCGELFNLRAINLLVRPNWEIDETVLNQKLIQLLKTVLTHPQKHMMTMLITAEDVESEAANLLLASLMMSVLEETEVDESEGEPDFILLTPEQMSQLESITPRITAQVLLECDRPLHEGVEAVPFTSLKDLENAQYPISSEPRAN
ncbi:MULTISPECIES: FkbM family methyltransferase [unclassified Leptolyngbya]|nr:MULTISPECIES: FkbM family methyltransferase [unclassified Leptolyngbya]